MNLETTIQIQAGGPGSGCVGSNCGRPKTYYHGTRSGLVGKIKKEGIKPNPDRIVGGRGFAFLTTKKETAQWYAKVRVIQQRNRNGVQEKKAILKIVVPKEHQSRVKPDPNEPKHRKGFRVKGGIPAEWIQ